MLQTPREPKGTASTVNQKITSVGSSSKASNNCSYGRAAEAHQGTYSTAAVQLNPFRGNIDPEESDDEVEMIQFGCNQHLQPFKGHQFNRGPGIGVKDLGGQKT